MKVFTWVGPLYPDERVMIGEAADVVTARYYMAAPTKAQVSRSAGYARPSQMKFLAEVSEGVKHTLGGVGVGKTVRADPLVTYVSVLKRSPSDPLFRSLRQQRRDPDPNLDMCRAEIEQRLARLEQHDTQKRKLMIDLRRSIVLQSLWPGVFEASTTPPRIAVVGSRSRGFVYRVIRGDGVRRAWPLDEVDPLLHPTSAPLIAEWLTGRARGTASPVSVELLRGTKDGR